MRIQHNIMAMNAYRNYNTNTSALSKNLEKLSSGYKINRAGDDAAGLAISEKMRAQITGLQAAQKNVKDGVSLVKTAEGAMQEIQDMLNRMDYLATQSANGTYQDEVDRENLNKEVSALKTEINRIADSANFNGIKLLDGSLAKTGKEVSGVSEIDLSKIGTDLTVNSKTIEATKGKYQTQDLLAQSSNYSGGISNMSNGDSIKLSFEITEDGKTSTKEITLKIGNKQDGSAAKQGIYLDDGSADGIWLADLAAAGTVDNTELAEALDKVFQQDNDLKEKFKYTDNADGTFDVEARERGTTAAALTGLKISVTDKDGKGANAPVTESWSVGIKTTKKAEDRFQAVNFATTTAYQGKVFDITASQNSATTVNKIEDAIFEINGKKFAFIQNGMGSDQDTLAALREAGVEHWVAVGAANTIDGTDVTNMIDKISKETGLLVEQGTSSVDANGDRIWTQNNTGTEVIFRLPAASSSTQSNGGLTLQIGDTADTWNQLNVAVGDMHTKAMGTGKTTLDGKEVDVTKTIADIDISSLEGAQEAIGVIKNAINYVSGVRGDLGAVQNRLEHTQKNLSVMEENIQDAESNIRDTDVANEMMAYTKNNILIQSAQAMLAQANQVPQGVLQLLG